MTRLAPDTENGDKGRLSLRIVRLSHAFAFAVREIFEDRLLRESAPAPLSIPQVHLLNYIQRNGACRIGDIAGFLGVSAPAASKNTEKLARLGLLRRRTPKRDRRISSIEITTDGADLLRKYRDLRVSNLSTLLNNFTLEDKMELSRLLERLVMKMIRVGERDGNGCLRCGAIVDDECPLHMATGNCPYEHARKDAEAASTLTRAGREA